MKVESKLATLITQLNFYSLSTINHRNCWNAISLASYIAIKL